tara:strand:+ start:634 stop:1032 length:399 start_codon:yes stop_codon:yes gene_type:complete
MSLIDCSKVYVTQSKMTDGFGAFSKQKFKQHDIIEIGLAYIVELDGNTNDHVFTWYEKSNPLNSPKWASCSGCATYYNTSLNPNVKMIRDFETNTFKIIALKDIEENEELHHTYKSLQWRECFNELNHILNN